MAEKLLTGMLSLNTNKIKYIVSFTDIANAWLETLLDVIDLLPKEVIKKDVSQIIDKVTDKVLHSLQYDACDASHTFTMK